MVINEHKIYPKIVTTFYSLTLASFNFSPVVRLTIFFVLIMSLIVPCNKEMPSPAAGTILFDSS